MFFQLNAQHIKNPSFEGKPGDSQLPPEWEHYGLYSTGDTQPGAWEVTTSPADGNTYISLITRGIELSNGNSWESCYQMLTTPLKKGRTYQYSIDLARSNTFASSTETYTQPVVLRIWGQRENGSDTELLWTSPPVRQTKWKRYEFQLSPAEINCDALILEAHFIKKPAYSGNILIDNFFYYPES